MFFGFALSCFINALIFDESICVAALDGWLVVAFDIFGMVGRLFREYTPIVINITMPAVRRFWSLWLFY